MKSKTKQKQVVKQKINLSMGDSPYLNNAASDPKSKQSANTQGKVKKAKSARKPKPKSKAKKMKQKQEVKQNVKVNVQASGGSGSGGSSIPTVPQYIPPQYIPNVPTYFQDRRGEDVILQKLSEVVDKFNSKPEPVEELPRVNPQPTEYIDGPEDAETQIISSNPILNPKPNTNNNSIQQQIEDAKRSVADEFFRMRQDIDNLKSQGIKQSKKLKSTGQPIINVPRDYQASAKKGWETKRQKAQEAKQAEQAKKKADIEVFWADENETPNEAMASKYFDDRSVKKAARRLKEYADNLNSDITYQGLKRDYEEDKKKSAENFTSPVKTAIAKLESNISSPVSKRTRSKANK